MRSNSHATLLIFLPSNCWLIFLIVVMRNTYANKREGGPLGDAVFTVMFLLGWHWEYTLSLTCLCLSTCNKCDDLVAQIAYTASEERHKACFVLRSVTCEFR